MHVAYLPRGLLTQFNENMPYKLYLNEFEKHYLDVHISQISSKYVQRFESQNILYVKIVNLPQNKHTHGQ